MYAFCISLAPSFEGCATQKRPRRRFPDPRATFASPQRSTHATASLPSFPASVFPSAPILHRDGAAACGDSRISHQSPLTNHQSLPWSRWDSPLRLEQLAVNCQLSTRLTPVECAVPSKHRVLPGFGRNCPSVSPLECAVTQIEAVTPLECAVPKKGGGEV